MNMDPCSGLVFVNFIKLKKSASHYVDYSQYFKSNFMREKYLVFLGSFKEKSRIRVLKNRHESSFIIPGWSYRAATLVQVGQKGFLKGTVSGDVYPPYLISINQPIRAPDWHAEVFSNMASILRRHSNRKFECFTSQWPWRSGVNNLSLVNQLIKMLFF